MLMNMYKRGYCGHTPLLNLCRSLQLWPAVSQSASKQSTRLPHGHRVETFFDTAKSRKGRRRSAGINYFNAGDSTLGDNFFLILGRGGTKDARTRKRRSLLSFFPMNLELVRPPDQSLIRHPCMFQPGEGSSGAVCRRPNHQYETSGSHSSPEA